MKALLLTSTGALLVAMVSSCGSSTSGGGSGGASTSGGAQGNSGGANGNSGGAQGNSGGANGNSGGAQGNSGGASTNSGGANGGGTANSGGRGGATSSTGGAAGGAPGNTGGAAGGATAAALPSIVSTGTGIDNYGTWYSPTQTAAQNQAFMITPCTDAGTGFDCANNGPTGACPAGGYRFQEAFRVMGGDPNATYDVAVNVLGQVEPKIYQGGAAAPGFTAANPNGVNNLLYTGGMVAPVNTDYNIFSLTIAAGTGALAAGAPTFYAFNHVDAGHAGSHYNFQIMESFTFSVRSGNTLTLEGFDSNCRAIMNCGNGGPYPSQTVQQCTGAARTVAGVTLPTTFRGMNLANGGAQPFQTQFVNLKITGVTAR